MGKQSINQTELSKLCYEENLNVIVITAEAIHFPSKP